MCGAVRFELTGEPLTTVSIPGSREIIIHEGYV